VGKNREDGVKNQDTTQKNQDTKQKITHDTDAKKQANRQGRCVGETKAIIGKLQGWGFTLLKSPLNS